MAPPLSATLDGMTLYQLLLIPKFVGVMLFGAGFVMALLARDVAERKRAVHRIASAGLGITWLFGVAASLVMGDSLHASWLAGSLLLSFFTQALLIMGVKRPPLVLVAIVPLLLTIVLMIVKPS